MRNLYISDLKRIVKDKLFFVVCILAGVFAIINPLLYKLIFAAVREYASGVMADMLYSTVNAKSLTFTAFLPSDNLGFVMAVLISIVVCKDFSQGTVRNKIICGRSRTSVYLSHLFSSATVMCGIMLVHGLLTLCVSLCFFPYQDTDFVMSDLWYLLSSLLFEMFVYFAIAAIVTFIAALSKNMGICILLYLAVLFGLSLVGSVLMLLPNTLDPDSAAHGVFEFICSLNIYTSSLIGTGSEYTLKDVLYILASPVIISTASTAFGISLFSRKNLK